MFVRCLFLTLMTLLGCESSIRYLSEGDFYGVDRIEIVRIDTSDPYIGIFSIYKNNVIESVEDENVINMFVSGVLDLYRSGANYADCEFSSNKAIFLYRNGARVGGVWLYGACMRVIKSPVAPKNAGVTINIGRRGVEKLSRLLVFGN